MNVIDRFLGYTAFPTMSDEESKTCPSTEKQLAFAKHVADDLISIGCSGVRIDENGYIFAEVPSNTDSDETIGLIAHMDTSPDAPDSPVRARTVLFDGKPVELNSDGDILYPAERYIGKRLIVTDGKTLLGADDKAGIAEIVSAVEDIIASGVLHKKIVIGITPDEEIGRGADLFDVKKFGADYAFTVDGGTLGELEYENFNAASAKITIHGVSVHPGSAKGIMKNASLIAFEFDRLLPENELPSLTEGYEGFHHLTSMEGVCEYAELSYIIRDHDRTRFEEKKKQFVLAADKLNEKYGIGTVELKIVDSYYNMKEKIEEHIEVVGYALDAMKKAGVEPKVVPIRGGTDGARLSFEGLPCPNICTGGENFHSRFEYIPVESMEKTVEIIRNLVSER